MKILIDRNLKKNSAIPDNFLTVPDKMTAKQLKALKRLQEIHKRKFTEVV